MTYQEAIDTLTSNIIKDFDEVFHSAEIVTIPDGKKFPAVSFNSEWIDLSPTDTKEIIYIRRNGNDEVQEDLRLSSCGKAYLMRSPHRVVFFKDHAKKHNEILAKLMQSTLIGGTKLRSISRDKWKLMKEESNGEYKFGPTTAYFSIDIYILWKLKSDTCEEDFCIDIPNPVKRELCPAVV